MATDVTSTLHRLGLPYREEPWPPTLHRRYIVFTSTLHRRYIEFWDVLCQKENDMAKGKITDIFKYTGLKISLLRSHLELKMMTSASATHLLLHGLVTEKGLVSIPEELVATLLNISRPTVRRNFDQLLDAQMMVKVGVNKRYGTNIYKLTDWEPPKEEHEEKTPVVVSAPLGFTPSHKTAVAKEEETELDRKLAEFASQVA